MDVFKEARRIKARLTACTTKDALRAAVSEEKDAFNALKSSGPDGKTMSIQIENLKNLMVGDFNRAERRVA